MNRLIFPTILSGIILFALVFAYFPVNEASTVHGTIGNTATILESQKTLPANSDDVTWTIACTTSGNIITAIWADNSATPDGDNEDFDLVDLKIAGNDYRTGIFNVSFSDGEFIYDVLSQIENAANTKVGRSPIPCPAGDTVTLVFDNNFPDPDDVILNLIVTVQGPSGVTLT